MLQATKEHYILVLGICLIACVHIQALSIPPKRAPPGEGPPPHQGAAMASDTAPDLDQGSDQESGMDRDPGTAVVPDPNDPSAPVAFDLLSINSQGLTGGTVHPNMMGYYTDFAGRVMSLEDGIGDDLPPPSEDPNYHPSRLWSPSADMGMKRDEWLKCHGMSCDQWQKVKDNIVAIGDMYGSMMDDVPPGSMPDPIHTKELLDGCIHLTLNQTRALKEDMEKLMDSDHQRRVKRKVVDFNYLARKWEDMPIVYTFDGMHDENQKRLIRNGFKHWEEQTCVRFQEVDMDSKVKDNYILITKESTGCHSFIGRVNVVPQQLNLQYNCLWEFGIIVHEIGHALGLWHEQQRADRDGYIQVQWENIDYYAGQFYTQKTISHGVPYDVGSVMHYAPTDGSNHGKVTMKTVDPLYQSSMGQKTGLSWMDAKIINEAYCKDRCNWYTLPRSCQRGGYQDPNDCYRCRCPDGFASTYCEQVAPSKGVSCGGVIDVGTDEMTVISPGYTGDLYYKDYTECTWLVRAPPHHQVALRFEGEFGAYCHYQKQCYHWVEVKYNKDWAYPGPRFCCYQTPQAQLLSDAEEMVIILKANYTTHWTTVRRGFQAKLKAEPMPGYEQFTVPTTTVTPGGGNAERTTQTPTVKPDLPGVKRMDLGFVIDSSGSIGRSNWPRMLRFIQNLVGKLRIGLEDNQIGVVSYGNRAEVNIYLDWYRDKNEVIRRVGEIAWKDQWTNTSGGLWLMHDNLFRGNYGKRSDAQHVAILVTDGEANVASDRTIPEAMAARLKGIYLFVIGVGSHVSNTELQGIAGDYGQVLRVKDFPELERDVMATLVLKKLTDEFGSGAPDMGGEDKPTTRPEVGVSWTCDFEQFSDSLCGAEQDRNDQFDWIRQSGNTPSQETGPDKAASGRFYLFIEASNPRRSGDIARLLMPEFGQQGAMCVQFSYHMYGFHVRRVSLIQNNGSHRRQVWTQEGEQGYRWMDARVDVTMDATDRLAIEGERGDEYSGDIAIDNIRVTSGSC